MADIIGSDLSLTIIYFDRHPSIQMTIRNATETSFRILDYYDLFHMFLAKRMCAILGPTSENAKEVIVD